MIIVTEEEEKKKSNPGRDQVYGGSAIRMGRLDLVFKN
jgi:hypothetical protein